MASDLDMCKVWMSHDPDLNGDMETSKITSGLLVEFVYEDGLRLWPSVWQPKRQGTTVSSTPEAETIAIATRLKS